MNFRKELILVVSNIVLAGLIIILGMSYIKGTSPSTGKTLSAVHSIANFKTVNMNQSKVSRSNDRDLNSVGNLDLAVEQQVNPESSKKIMRELIETTHETSQNLITPVSGTINSKTAGSSKNTKIITLMNINKVDLKKNSNNFQEVYKVPKGYCALTFDDGPTDYSVRIAKLLKANHAPATFFVIGENVRSNPSVVKYESELGFSVQDHSETHPVMVRLSEASQTKQILQAQKEIEALTHKPVTLFRPPYGSFNATTKEILVENHMKMALWNDDPRDWDAKSADALIKTISNSNLSGTIIDLHDKKITYQALPEILKIIKNKGLKLTAI